MRQTSGKWAHVEETGPERAVKPAFSVPPQCPAKPGIPCPGHGFPGVSPAYRGIFDFSRAKMT
jgi:hypothetical protein